MLDLGRGHAKTGCLGTLWRATLAMGGADPACVILSLSPGRSGNHGICSRIEKLLPWDSRRRAAEKSVFVRCKSYQSTPISFQ